MGDELEYVISGALMECTEGTVPMAFQATPRNVRIQGLKVGNASDKVPIVNIPSFTICKKLTQMAGGTPTPCVPAPMMWQDTYPVQVNKQEVLILRSCIRCTSGQGTIEFMTSGQTPVSPEVSQQLEEMQKEAQEALDEAEAEKNSVGEAGFFEGMIPIWGSGRDMIHSIQTGNWGMAALNAGFLVWDVASVAAGLVSFGTATVAMQGAKAGVRGLIKAGVKVAAKGAARKFAALMAKSIAMKQGLKKGLLKLAATRVCVLACFPAGTSVAVQEGYRNIEDLEAGDLVWSRNEFSGQLELNPVVSTMSRETDHLIHLRLGGERIQTTAEHPFYSRQGWQKAGTLAVGDEVVRSDGQWVSVTEIAHQTEFDQPVVVYNIEVAHAHTYFVGKWMWWVHNAEVCVAKIIRETKDAAEQVVKKLGEPRLGTRRIPDSEYSKLRKKTPSDKIRDSVNENYIEGMPDEALPGFRVDKRLHAEHVVSMDQITKMEGFDKLTEAQKLEVLNNPENFIGLSEAANTSKGSKTYEAWTHHKKTGTPVDPAFRQKMMNAEKETARKLQKQIDDMVALNEK